MLNKGLLWLRLRLGLRLGWADWPGRAWGNERNIGAGSSKRGSNSVALLILITRLGWGWIQAPLGPQWLVDLLGLSELEVADFLGNGGAFSNWFKPGNQLGLEAAGLLRIQVASFFRDINESGEDLIVALFRTLFGFTSSTTDFNGQFFAVGVTN